MKTTPDISIIIPAYNVEQYIGQCLDSILRQDGADAFEIIVVNDGSTDKTSEIVQEYRHGYTNVHLVTQKNRGVSVARNHAIDVARGRFISFVDADDMVGLSYKQMLHYFQNTDMLRLCASSDKVRDNMRLTFMYFNSAFNMDDIQPSFDTQYFTRLMNPLRDDGIDVSFGGKITIDREKRGLLRHVYEHDQVYSSRPKDKQIIIHHADIRESANFALYRRKFLNNANLRFIQGMHLDEDMLFTQQAALRARNIATVTDTTYLYNRHSGTLSNLTPTIMGINPKYELAMIQRHSMILSEFYEIPRFKYVYNYLLKQYSRDEQKIELYADATLPEYCAQCNRDKCDKCPAQESVITLLQCNIKKYLQR